MSTVKLQLASANPHSDDLTGEQCHNMIGMTTEVAGLLLYKCVVTRGPRVYKALRQLE